MRYAANNTVVCAICVMVGCTVVKAGEVRWFDIIFRPGRVEVKRRANQIKDFRATNTRCNSEAPIDDDLMICRREPRWRDMDYSSQAFKRIACYGLPIREDYDERENPQKPPTSQTGIVH